MDIQRFQKVHEFLVDMLLEYGMSKEEALKISSTFFFAWYKSTQEEERKVEMYEEAVKEYLDRFKERL